MESGADDSAVLAAAIVLEAAGTPREAAATIERHPFALAFAPGAAALRGRILEDAGEVDAGWQAYADALRTFPEDALLNLRAGVLSYRRGDLTDGERRLRHSWSVSPSAEAALYLARICDGTLRRDQAREFLVRAVILDGGQGAWRAKATGELQRRD